MSDIGWIKDLQPGDRVATTSRSMIFRGTHSILIVKKITPTGRVRTTDGRQFHPDGRELGDSYARLVQLTPQIEEEIERKKIIVQLRTDAIMKLPTDKLRTLLTWQEEMKLKEVGQ